MRPQGSDQQSHLLVAQTENVDINAAGTARWANHHGPNIPMLRTILRRLLKPEDKKSGG